jgi:tetratricopeptide (TPR) repeat protein
VKKICILIYFLFASFASAQSVLGKVDFPATGKPEAQPFFLKGLLLLHSFEYEDARDEFENAIKSDPDFVMAYWGAAMTHNHPIWMEQNQDAARAILIRLGASSQERQKRATTQREKDWLSTLEILYGDGTKEERDLKYEKAMDELSQKYPDDLEASIFHALAILGTAHNGRDFRIYMRAAGILEEAYFKSPDHPGVLHYMIHCYDDPIHATLGLRAARKYAAIAPDAGHAQHMPSHIFLALGMWPETVGSNRNAFDVADQRVRKKKLGLEERGYHYLHWLEYGHLQLGMFSKARQELGIIDIDSQKSGSSRAISFLIRMRAAYILETEGWNSDAVPMLADPSKVKLTAAAIHLFTNGYVALKKADLPKAKKTLQELQDRIQKSTGSTSESHHGMASSQNYDLDQKTVSILADELKAAILFAEGKREEAVNLLRKTSAQEDELTFEFGPPDIVKPSHELLGELLLEMKEPKDALQQFQLALERGPKRMHALQGLLRAASESGDEQIKTETQKELDNMKSKAKEMEDPGLVQ